MDFDLIFRDARIAGREERCVDIGIRDGRFAAVEAGLPGGGPEERLDGRLVLPGLVETHIHLDKSRLTARCNCHTGTVQEAIAEVARAKRDFTEEDVYERARRTLERAILQGTTRMRSHVEVDPRIGLTSLRALLRLKRDYAWAIDLRLCAFPQEGLLDDPGCEDVLVQALEAGADAVGGAPYMDRDSHGQIARIFALARRYDLDIDLHLDFSLDPSHFDLEEVCRLADACRWGGRVAIGHVTKLSAVPRERFEALGRRLADAGIALTVLPSTDLFLNGQGHEHSVPRGVAPAHRLLAAGVTCSLATNNVLNPFTPFGDCSLVRIANLYANIAQIGTPADIAGCLDMVTTQPAALLNLADYGIAPGRPADLVVLDAASRAAAVAEIAPPLTVVKAGRRTVTRPRPLLHRPG
ncbi:amidohydrolase family protein [Labrys monachus]|uniref:Cytosine deaminase n=1 Tax=Labrys monachus TaxID=217067 RepID=A0ABU0FPH6_9HYPH|nr:amidohydrolase family protein [Labrys monachus]MDQ0396441.1 cytosine deaminase [Labrys monachus]